MELRSNEQIDLAHQFLCNTGAHIFLTGRAGTGKTTFLRTAIERLHKRVVVAAPTGVAAINAGGVTLHSLFQLPFSIYLPGVAQPSADKRGFRFKMSRRKIALIRSIELLVIDEISMVRCDLLDAIDETLRRVRRDGRPFGGVQLLMIGDIQQLSPICHDNEWEILREHYATPYFFESKALKECDYITIELQEIFRQSDPHFTSLLNAIRDNAITAEVIERLNERYIPDFNPSEDEGYITLSTHNNSSNAINSRKLKALESSSQIYTAQIKGDYPSSAYPNDTDLELKVGAQVIFIKNDLSPEKLYYNGLIGEVVATSDKDVTVKPRDGRADIVVGAVAWENIEYNLDSESGEIREEVKGSFSQLPLRCAWAITIHKSQGLSFDRAIIDAGSSFAHGQVYVALSRCRTLEGMVLSTPLREWAIIKDNNVETFSQKVSDSQPTPNDLERHTRAYLCSNLCELFGFSKLHQMVTSVVRHLSGHLYLEYPQLCNSLADVARTIQSEAVKFGDGFQRQIIQITSVPDSVENKLLLDDRLAKAAQYFEPRILPLLPLIEELSKVQPDAAELKKRLKESYDALTEELTIKVAALKLCAEGFTVERYQRIRVESIAENIKDKKTAKRKSIAKANAQPTGEKQSTSSDIVNEDLYNILRDWRRLEAEDRGLPVFGVLSNRALMEIQAKLPTTEADLKKISGVGVIKLKQFGEAVLTIVRDYCYDNDL